VHFLSGTRSNTLGFSITSTDINDGDLVKGSGPEAYYISIGLKKHIPNPETFNILQFAWKDIKPISDSLLDSIPLGNSVPTLTNSMVIKQGNDIHVYIIESGKKRWIPNEQTLDSLGRRFEEVIPIEALFFARIALGEQIPDYSHSPPSTTPSPQTVSLGLKSNSSYVAEPVNIALGNYIFQHTDLKMPGRGLSFEFKRTYNSADTYSGPLGAGWTHSYNVLATEKLVDGTEDQAFVKWGDGHEAFHTYSDGSYVSDYGYDTLSKNLDQLELTTREQVQYRFFREGSVNFEDSGGHTITYILEFG